MTVSITTNYDVLYELKSNPQYKFTEKGICINSQRGTIVKRIMKGNSIGFIIAGHFIPKTELRKELVKIEKTYIPF